ncbi:MAG: hypothetical protein U9N44_00805 [Chloroflexota bacterium]|nr:hypothetical protein [Chloroflexota bacterium]
MALVQYGAGVIQMSGSIAGTTFAHNRSGNYARARTKPVNPASAIQEKIRAVIAYLTDRWLETVTADQRAAWGDYARAVGMKNRLGIDINLSGFNHYIRSNAARLYADQAIVDAAPTTMALPEHDPTLAFSCSEASQELEVAFDDTAAWAAEVGGFMFIRMARPQSPTRNFFAGPYLFADTIVGDTTPVTSPATIAVPTPVAEGHRLWLSARIARADGRLSESFAVGPTDAAA